MLCEHQPYPGAGFHCLLDDGHGPDKHMGIVVHTDLTLPWDETGSFDIGPCVFGNHRDCAVPGCPCEADICHAGQHANPAAEARREQAKAALRAARGTQ
jgi:hypothetical protein